MHEGMEFIFVLTTVEAELGGIARSVPALAAAVARTGVPTRVLAVSAPSMTVGPDSFPGCTVRFCSDRADARKTLRRWTEEASSGCILYHAGVWDPLNHFVAASGRRRRRPFIASPRSMLDPWALAHRKWKKRLAWWLYARRDLHGAAAVHATADLESGYIRAAGYRGPVFVVPNGIAFPDRSPSRLEKGGGMPKRLLFLSRIHEKKGIPDLIEAFARNAPPDWELIIAGNDDGGHEGVCRALAARQANAGQIHFHGPVSDTAKWNLYASSDLFVLPSYSENFGIVVGEALAAGLPVITTTATPWEDLVRRRCGWCVPTGAGPLAKVLREALSLSPDERKAMGDRGARWVRQEFAWPRVGEDFVRAVRGIAAQ